MDIINNYKKHKKLSNLTIVIISLIVAISINFMLINNTEISKNLKTSVIESKVQNDLWDIYLENIWNNILLKTNKSINNVSNLTLSISYNPENVKINDIIPKYNAEISNISNTEGLNTIIILFAENNSLEKSEKILTIKTEKSENKTENINIVNANFTDSENNIYELTTSWIAY